MNNDSYDRMFRKNGSSGERGGDIMKKTYKIEVDCANCALKMEEAAKKVEGVQGATVSFMTQKMKVEFAEGADEKAVMCSVRRACKKVEDDCEIFLE
jgi:cation transport ATPase